jgi:predicted nicotinamide N-methyase
MSEVLRVSLAERVAALRGAPPADAALDLVREEVDLGAPGAAVTIVRPRSWKALLEAESAVGRPTPYWAITWPSGEALARAVARAGEELDGRRVLELGCGLALPSLAAARAGAQVVATDGVPEAVAFAAHNLALNDLTGEAAVADWRLGSEAFQVLGPYDLVLAADVLYVRRGVDALEALLPRRAGEVWLADPGRAGAAELLSRTERDWHCETERDGDVGLHRLRLRA